MDIGQTPYRYFLIAFVFVLIFLGGLLGSSWLLLRTAYFLALAAIFGFLWTRFSSTRGVKASFEISPSYLQAGKTLSLTLSVKNRSVLPKLWLETSIPSTMPDGSFDRVVSLLGNDETKWHSSVPVSRRGLYTVGPLNISARDPFRLVQRQMVYGKPVEVLVFPETEDLPYFDADMDKKGSAHFSRMFRDFLSSQVAGVRPYVSGDSLRHIHWPSTARTGKLMVKTLDSDTADYVWLVLDMQEAAHSAGGASEEYLVKVAASVAKKLLEAGRSVGLIYYGEERHLVEIGRGAAHLWNLLRALAVARARGHIPLPQVVWNEMPLLCRAFSIIVFSAGVETDLIFAVDDLKNQGTMPRIVLLDHDSFEMAGSASPLLAGFRARGLVTYLLSAGQSLSEGLDDRKLGAAPKIPIGVRSMPGM